MKVALMGEDVIIFKYFGIFIRRTIAIGRDGYPSQKEAFVLVDHHRFPKSEKALKRGILPGQLEYPQITIVPPRRKSGFSKRGGIQLLGMVQMRIGYIHIGIQEEIKITGRMEAKFRKHIFYVIAKIAIIF